MPLTTFASRVDFRAKKRLEKLTKRTGRSRSSFAAEAIEEYVRASEWQIAGVRRAMRALDRGEGVAHEKVKDYLLATPSRYSREPTRFLKSRCR